MHRIFCCLWKGEDLPGFSADKYDVSDVAKLARGFRRHLTVEHEFVLIVDANYDYAARTLLPDDLVTVLPMEGWGIGGWSNMLEPYRPGLRSSERSLLVGLDTIVVGNCDWLFEWDEAPMGLPWDPFQKETVCDAVVTWDKHGAEIVWEAFLKSRKDGMKCHLLFGRPSEMILFRDLWTQLGWPTLELTPKRLLSYKCHVKGRSGRDRSWDKASIVYFHGNPKPCHLHKTHPLRQEWERIETELHGHR